MPSKPHVRRRRARKNEIRERIIDAARSLFAIEGVEALTMRRIGEECDYTPSAIYKHFRNKDELIAELRHDALSRLALCMSEGIASVEARQGGALVALREAADRYLAFASGEREAYVLAFGTSSPESFESAPVIEALAELITRARRGSEISEEDHNGALVLWHALHGRALSPRRPPQENTAFVDLCLSLLALGYIR